METIGHMPVLLLLVFGSSPLLLSGHQAVALENATLRMQVAASQRKRKRPLPTTLDRVFWITLLWSDWRHPWPYVQADTVVRWQRERFRRLWVRPWKPQRRGRGRPAPPQNFADGSNEWRSPIRCGGTPDSWRTQDARHRHAEAYFPARPVAAKKLDETTTILRAKANA